MNASKIQILIVDDEKLICEELCSLLEQVKEVEIVGVCHNGNDALAAAKKQKPDVIFLDIEMPGLTGLQVAKRLIGWTPHPLIVFATAFDQFALDAFKVDAVDYLLKPFDEQDIERVMQKVKTILVLQQGPDEKLPPISRKDEVLPNKFLLERDGKMEIIDSSTIQMVFAKDRLVFVRTIDGKTCNTHLSLLLFENRLDPNSFFRCHRNYIVNMNQIQQLSHWFNRGFLLVLKGQEKTEVPVSRVYAKKLKEYIHF